jgi:hypothetical protein
MREWRIGKDQGKQELFSIIWIWYYNCSALVWNNRRWVGHGGRNGALEGASKMKLSVRYFVYTVTGSGAQRQQIKRKQRVGEGDGI